MLREEGNVKTEAESEVTLSRAKECLELPEAGRDKEEFYRRGSGRRMALLARFRLLASRTTRQYIAIMLNYPIVVLCYGSPRN